MITTWSAARYFTSSDSREDPSSSDGLGGESPAKITRSPGTGVLTRALSRDVAPTSSWARPGRFLPALKSRLSRGRRRSPSMRMTSCPASAMTLARFTAMVDLPSSWTQEETTRLRSPSSMPAPA